MEEFKISFLRWSSPVAVYLNLFHVPDVIGFVHLKDAVQNLICELPGCFIWRFPARFVAADRIRLGICFKTVVHDIDNGDNLHSFRHQRFFLLFFSCHIFIGCIKLQGSIGHDFSIRIPYHIKESNVESFDMVFLDEVHLAAVHLPGCTPIVGGALVFCCCILWTGNQTDAGE